MGSHRYNIAVRKRGGTTREFDVESEYAHGWFIMALKELIEKKELGECNDPNEWAGRAQKKSKEGKEIAEQMLKALE